MGKKIYGLIFLSILVLGIAVVIMKGAENTGYAINDNGEKIDFYTSGSCGCCSVYSGYLENNGFSLNVISGDAAEVKEKFGVPLEMESCHTYFIGGYFVEGHMPLEAVEKLLKEKPDIAGIALPGMPSGSPGMTGAKKEDFVIYAVNKDGTYNEFMRI